MSTAIEVPDLEALFLLVKKVHQAQVDEGGQRIVIDLKVDDRREKTATMGETECCEISKSGIGINR